MSNINPIKFGINPNQYFKQEEKEDLAKKSSKEQKNVQANNKQLESAEVLGFMAAQNADIVPAKAQRTLDISKYVTKEQEARIADFMKGFEADFDEAVDSAMNEFPDLSENAARGIALAFVNSAYEK